MRKLFGIVALAALAGMAACAKDGEKETTTGDSTVVTGTDSIEMTVAVPTTDTIVTESTTTVETDTIEGEAPDSVQ